MLGRGVQWRLSTVRAAATAAERSPLLCWAVNNYAGTLSQGEGTSSSALALFQEAFKAKPLGL